MNNYNDEPLNLPLPRLRQDQWDIVQHPAKVKLVACGRRWGKTTTAGSVAIAAASQGARVAWIVPIYKNSYGLWNDLERILAQGVARKKVIMRKHERTIHFKDSGGTLYVFSADRETSIRSNAYHLVVVDEAARISSEIWDATIEPTLADYDGDAILISTPKGRNFFYRLWLRGRSGRDPRYAAFQAPSYANPNPNIQAAFLRAKDSVSRRIFQEEWLAEFVENSGTVFSNVADTCVAQEIKRPVPGREYVAGVDWGRDNDYTVISIFDTTTRQQVYMRRYVGIDWSLQRKKIVALSERFGLTQILAEENAAGSPNITELQEAGLPVHPFNMNGKTKPKLIDNFVFAVERGPEDTEKGVTLLENQYLMDEMMSYTQKRSPSGNWKYSAPRGMNDDTVVATALGYKAMTSSMVDVASWSDVWPV